MEIAGAIYLLGPIQNGTGISQGDRLMTKEACELRVKFGTALRTKV